MFHRINFHDNKLPAFKENKAKGIYTFGEDNLYPEFLIEMYNKSPKHNAIVSAKASYLAGVGTSIKGQDTAIIAKAQQKVDAINAYESLDELKAKVADDLELFNGFALEVIWSRDKQKISEIYHLPFQKIRKTLDDKFAFCEDWSDRKCEIIEYTPFNPITRESKQLYYCQLYRAGQGIYPLPDYVGGLKYIEIDTEVSNWHLNSIKNGFSAQTLIQMFKGYPTPEEARKTERALKKNYTGTDNAGGLIIQYNDPNEKESIINNLQPSDFDKQFDILNKTVQQEIFVSHKVNSPMLFGVRVEGQLGGRSELIEAYEMFQSAYVEPRQKKLDDALTYLFEYIAPVQLRTENKPPLGLDYSELFAKGIITNEEARQEMGLPQLSTVKVQSSLNDAINSLSPLVANNVLSNMTINEKRQLAGLPPIPNGDAIESATPAAFSKQNPFGWDDERDLQVFAKYGESADLYEEVKFEFGDALNKALLNILAENPGLQTGDLVNLTKQPAQNVMDALTELIKSDRIAPEVNGYKVTAKGRDLIKGLETELVVRYQYEKAPGIEGGILLPTSRDFCRKIVESNKVFSREDINQMSAELGYDVWKRRGGWYHNPKTDTNTPQCRHIFSQKVMIRKK